MIRRPAFSPPTANKDVFWGMVRRRARIRYFGKLSAIRYGVRRKWRKFGCWSGYWHEKETQTARFQHLRIDVTTCTSCCRYLSSGPIYTEVPCDVEVPFEGFKIESLGNNDPTSAFYWPPIILEDEETPNFDGPTQPRVGNREIEVKNS